MVATHIRAAVRRGSTIRALRKELRVLDDGRLLARLARYNGHTPGELRRQYRNLYAASTRAVNRDRLIDAIVEIEVP